MSAPSLSTYAGFNAAVGYAGQIVDGTPADIDSFANQDATAIDFGAPVCRGSANNSCKPFEAYAEEFIGVSVRDAAVIEAVSSAVTYARYAEVPVLRSGMIWAKCIDATVRGGDVYIDTADATGFGAIAGGATNGSTRKIVRGLRWDSSASAGELAKLLVVAGAPINLTT